MNRTSLDKSSRLQSVRDFWESHLNSEYYTPSVRGSEEYFVQIERRRYYWHYHLRDLFQELRGSSGKLLEVGCGMGMDGVQLARCGFDVTAIDLTESAIEVARKLAAARNVTIEFRVGNAEALEFSDGVFDVVYSFGVLHHTPDIDRAIAELLRVLRPGGRAYVMLYHRRSLVALVHRILRLPYESPRNLRDHCPVVHLFTRRLARALFRGFSEVEITTEYPFTYGFRHLAFWIPERVRRMIGRWIGWHLMIRAIR